MSRLLGDRSGGCVSRLVGLVGLAIVLAVALALAVIPSRWLPSGIGLRPTPLSVEFKPSLVGLGQVAIIENPTETTLYGVKMFTAESRASGKPDLHKETWRPGESLKLGWTKGWRFDSGETFRASAAGYRTMRWEVP
jgi:hypothetical protein